MRTTRAIVPLALVLILAADTATSQVQAPGEVTVTLRVAGDRGQFRPGEIIPIELTFASSVPKRFVVDGATYDRSGRLTIDEFRVAPIQLVADPLLDYLATSGGFIGGGIRGTGTLGEKPYTVSLQLNDWFRFDTPGVFTLSVRSTRVTDEARRTTSTPFVVPVESNSVSFEILPRDRQWEEREQARALAILSGPPNTRDFRTGCRILRFLGTPAAVDEMIRRHDDDSCGFDFMVGLVSAPDRFDVVRQLEARLRAPDQAITQTYLRTLAMLSVYLRQPELRPAPTAAAKGRLLPGGDDLSRRLDAIQAETEVYARVLETALPLKTSRARAISAAEYAAYVQRASAMPPTGDASPRQQLIAAFLELPDARQRSLLESGWQAIADPAMVPALRRLAGGAGVVADLALRRLYQLAPEEGRTRILDAVRHPRSGMTLRTLGMLPDATLPELDEDIARGVETEITDIGVGLLHRYASPAVATRMLQHIGGLIGTLACMPQRYALAYFLRVSPADGAQLLDRALASRSSTGCYRSVLIDTAMLYRTPDLEGRAIALLDDVESAVVENAVTTLTRFGSPAAIPPLRAHFESWHREWRGRAGELRYNQTLAPRDQPAAVNATIELAYLQALAAAHGWLTDAAEIAGLRELCVTDNCRRSADSLLSAAGDTTVTVTRFDGPDDLSVRLAQYEIDSLAALASKLAQYPKEAVFSLRVLSGDNEQVRVVTDAMVAWARKQNLVLQP